MTKRNTIRTDDYMFYGQRTSGFCVLFCLVLFIAMEDMFAADSPSATGLWKNEDASFEIYEENGKLSAKIVSLREPLAPDGEKMAVLTPITRPAESSNGPPEFPGLMAASV